MAAGTLDVRSMASRRPPETSSRSRCVADNRESQPLEVSAPVEQLVGRGQFIVASAETAVPSSRKTASERHRHGRCGLTSNATIIDHGMCQVQNVLKTNTSPASATSRIRNPTPCDDPGQKAKDHHPDSRAPLAGSNTSGNAERDDRHEQHRRARYEPRPSPTRTQHYRLTTAVIHPHRVPARRWRAA